MTLSREPRVFATPPGRCVEAPLWEREGSGCHLVCMNRLIAMTVTRAGRDVIVTNWTPDYFDAHGRDADPDAYRWADPRPLALGLESLWCIWEIAASEGWFNGI